MCARSKNEKAYTQKQAVGDKALDLDWDPGAMGKFIDLGDAQEKDVKWG